MKIDCVYVTTIVDNPAYRNELVARVLAIPVPYNTTIKVMSGFDGKIYVQDPELYDFKPYKNWEDKDSRWSWWKRPMLAGEIGCAISHLRCWEDAYENGYETVIIFEDDFTILKNINWGIFNELIGYEWDVCMLSCNTMEDKFAEVEKTREIRMNHFIKPAFYYNAHSYMLSKEGIRRLIEDHRDVFKQNLIPADEILPALTNSHPRSDIREMFISNMTGIATREHYFGQSRNESTGNSTTETKDLYLKDDTLILDEVKQNETTETSGITENNIDEND